ncbi:primosomal protein N' [Candidatus Eisenbacteria bacterium]|uniref:Replication restart protein PriA n=1 Tax=Eiseniibacteriota bacterium TaxID=2212470 RepID=A0ABV6YPF5_UNCEI
MKRTLKADVAVPIPIEKTLAYSVPSELEDLINVGARVTVPLRGKVVTGFVRSLSRVGEGERKLKAVKSIADANPVLTEELYELAGWIAGYYMAPIGEVLAAMSPPAVKFKRVYKLEKAPGDLELEMIKASDPVRGAIIDALSSGKPIGLDTVKRKAGTPDIENQLQSLEADNYISHKTVAVKRRGSRLLAKKLEAMAASLADDGPGEGGESGEPAGPPKTPDRRRDEALLLTAHQEAAFQGISKNIDEAEFGVSLILGVTGSGKTEVYLRLIERVVAKGRKAIYLVPEIALTPQIMERVGERFGGRAALLHSGLSTGERYDTWQRIMAGDVDVVVGARSAVFAPFKDLGLIVVDEEHDTSYKQQDSPRYNAREVAIVRARAAGAVVVMGSATPTIETYHAALEGRYGFHELPERISGGVLPEVEVVDMRERYSESPLSEEARKAIEASVERDEQVLLFLNRRGFSNFIQCADCGLVPRCRNCCVSLTFHSGRKDLKCHYCDHTEPGWDECPKCGGSNITYVGLGTQRVEDHIAEKFPDTTCARFDRDATRRKGSTEALLNDFGSGMVRFLVGTQMLAKGHDFRSVGLVVVVNADVSMNLPDFRSGERTFQILTQVAGRAGRGEVAGKVIVQTFNPDHHSLKYVTAHDFKGFYAEEAEMRQELGYPPFSRLIRVVVEAREQAQAETAARNLASLAAQQAEALHKAGSFNQDGSPRNKIEVIGPSRAPLAKLRNVHRWHLMVRGAPRKNLSPFVRKCLDTLRAGSLSPGVKFSVDVDPQVMI